MKIDLILAAMFVTGVTWTVLQIAKAVLNYDERRDARRRNHAHRQR